MKNKKLTLEYKDQKFSIPDGAKAYRELHIAVTEAGLLEKDYTYYIYLNIFCLFGIAFSLYQVIIQHQMIPLIIWTFIFSFISVQIGGLMHDAGHRTIFKSTKFNDIVGHIYGAFLAVGYSSWKSRHNRHHAHSNEIKEDHDIFNFSFLSFYPDRLKENKGILRYLNKFQTVFYYPIFLFFTFGMRGYAVQYFRQNFRKHYLEIAIYIIGLFSWYLLPFFVFDFQKALVFFLVNNIVMGFYYMNIFAANHKPMPLISKSIKLSFMEQQIVTSCNVTPNRVYDFIYLGLNYQIEHHLFPNTPRPKLKYIRPYVMQFCKQRKLPYTCVSVLEVNKMILTRLHEVSKTVEV